VTTLVIDKPVGPSSFAVVNRLRHILARAGGRKARSIKIGHGGTLDPMASGVLPVCVGEGTKVVAFLLDADKEYEAQVRFGVETDTLDATGKVVAEHSVEGLDCAVIDAALSRFRGAIDQVPPMFSALKRNGRPLYEYARAGQDVPRPPRRVIVHDLELLEFCPPDRARLRIRCSKGTYVRSLAADLGHDLRVGGHLIGLRRTASGPFHIARACTFEDVERLVADGQPLPFVSLRQALAHLPAVAVNSELAKALSLGQRVPWARLGADGMSGPVCIVRESEADDLVAVAEEGEAGLLKLLRVFNRSVDSVPVM
jgi:tRNA pseudouridine55 synthase